MSDQVTSKPRPDTQ